MGDLNDNKVELDSQLIVNRIGLNDEADALSNRALTPERSYTSSCSSESEIPSPFQQDQIHEEEYVTSNENSKFENMLNGSCTNGIAHDLSQIHMTNGDDRDRNSITNLACVVQQDPMYGYYLKAGRNLRMGEIVLKETPILDGPSRESEIICLECYGDCGSLEDDLILQTCSLCSLPLCNTCSSSLADQSRSRHMPECTIFQPHKLLASRLLKEDHTVLHEIILVIRSLYLRQSDPAMWLQLIQLEAHLDDREGTELNDRAHNVANLILDKKLLTQNIDTYTIILICGILDINSFEVTGVWANGGQVQAVYAVACLYEHNCIPNTHRSFFQDDLSVCIRAAIDIKKDERISVTYTDSLWATAERRSYLAVTKHFLCECDRCQDATEMGTYLSGLKCSKCSVGYLLSEDPLGDICEASWRCRTCGHRESSEYATGVNVQVAGTIHMMEKSGINPDQCQKFIDIHQQILHPQHAHMLDVKHTLLHLLGHSEGLLMADLTEQQLQIKENIARCLISIAERLIPGISRLKGTTLYELFLVYQQRGLNWLEPSSLKTKRHAISSFKVAKTHLKECIRILQYEPEHQPEGKLLKRGICDLELLNEYMANLLKDV